MEGLEVAGHRQAYQVLLPANHLIVNCVLLTLDINFKSSLCTLYRGGLLHQAFFLTPAAEKTKTQAKNSSQKHKEKTQSQGGTFYILQKNSRKKT